MEKTKKYTVTATIPGPPAEGGIYGPHRFPFGEKDYRDLFILFANWNGEDLADIDLILKDPKDYRATLPHERDAMKDVIDHPDLKEEGYMPNIRQFHRGFRKLLDYMIENDSELPNPDDSEYDDNATLAELCQTASYTLNRITLSAVPEQSDIDQDNLSMPDSLYL